MNEYDALKRKNDRFYAKNHAMSWVAEIGFFSKSLNEKLFMYRNLKIFAAWMLDNPAIQNNMFFYYMTKFNKYLLEIIKRDIQQMTEVENVACTTRQR